MNPQVWVKKATLLKGSKSEQRRRSLKNRGLLNVFQGDGILVGSDNHRIHFWADESIEAEPVGEVEYPLKRVRDYLEQGRAGAELCEFTTYSLKKACSIAQTFFRKSVNFSIMPAFVYVCALEEHFEMATSAEEVGSMQYTLKTGDIWVLHKSSRDLFYDFKADAPDHFYVDPKYFKQALDGMGKSAVLRKDGDLLYLKGETGAEAVIMPLGFKPFAKVHPPTLDLE